ncbi:MAG: hypothetical protein MHM6MM_001590 [Cercozoa sp. M6MM]
MMISGILRRNSARMSSVAATRSFFTRDDVNPAVLRAKYAVRGELLIRADALAAQGRKIIFCNIGNPQSLGQRPLTYVRQLLAACSFPEMADHFPVDVQERCREILASTPCNSIGAYSHSQGLTAIRESVVEFLHRRDGHEAAIDNIFLSDGASPGIKNVLQLLIADSQDGVLLPTPQYPLYSASVALLGGQAVQYYLDEESGWSLDVEELREQLRSARAQGTRVRALVVINPGNPTGACLPVSVMEDVVRLCEEEKLVLLADEVYQENIYSDDTKFVSFKKVASDLGASVPLFSFHSVSKGMLGECGLRGGYTELHNVDSDVHAQLYKMSSVSLCSGLAGQIAVDAMVRPPVPGNPSFPLYEQEYTAQFESLQRRAEKLSARLNAIPGMSSQPVAASMYAFPSVQLPARAVAAAEAQGKEPDALYCMELLEETGICVVPGSGFGQRDGTFHFRTTILPPESDFDEVCEALGVFHAKFLERYQ